MNLIIIKYVDHKLVDDYIIKLDYQRDATIVKGGDEEIEFTDEDLLKLNNVDDIITVEDEYKGNVKVITADAKFYPNDKISEVKEKIQIVTGIPIFRQHLYYIVNGKAIQMSYMIRTQPMKSIDIRSINDIKEYIEDIPIGEQLQDAVIEAYDEFRIFKQISNVTNNIYLVDLSTFIDRPRLNSLMIDNYTVNTIYFSFILKYYPMMTRDIFINYIKNDSIKEYYPSLYPDNEALIKKFKSEDSILMEMSKLSKSKIEAVEKLIHIGISNAVLVSVNTREVDIINLFEKYACDDIIRYCKCKTQIDGKNVLLSKVYKRYELSDDVFDLNSILFNIAVELSCSISSYITLIISQNGTIYVKIRWRDDFNINFEQMYTIIDKYVNPVIATINRMGKTIINLPLIEVNRDTLKIANLSMSIYWNKSVSSKNYKIILENLRQLVTANIIATRIYDSEYAFIKGMYRFNHILIEQVVKNLSNYYTYMTDPSVKQKWDFLFSKTKIYKVHHRYSDVKFDISNIREEERDVVYKYTVGILALAFESMTIEEEKKVEKKLKKLKEVDPELYLFNTKNNNKDMISKKCQQPLQPIIYTDEEYAAFDAKRKATLLKYWNFTSNSPAYYECPNPKFPYIKFITDLHPKKYCIPCCKSMQISDDPKNRKTIMHNQCLEKHQVDIIENESAKKSRYVSSYGKDIAENRLSYLPEASLDIMINGYQNINDEECNLTVNYLLVGVPQTYNGNNMGVLYCISTLLDLSVKEYISEVNSYIHSNMTSIHLFDKYGVESYDQFNSIIDGTVQSDINLLLIELSEVIFGVKIILFQIKDNDAAILDVPSNMVDVEAYFSSKILYLLSKDADSVKLRHYYPIMYIDKEDFYKDNSVIAKSFGRMNKITIAVADIIAKNLKSETKLYHSNLELFIIDKMVNSSTEYSIHKYYINKSNHCYGVELEHEGALFYIPCHPNIVTASTMAYYGPLEEIPPFKLVDKFISDYNKYNVKESKAVRSSELIYPTIEITSYILFDGKVIGFYAVGLPFYCKDVIVGKYRPKQKIKNRNSVGESNLGGVLGELKSPVGISLLYNPIEINKLTMDSKSFICEKDKKEFAAAIANKYAYKIVMLFLSNIFENERNLPMRKKLLANILSAKYDKLLILDKKDYNMISTIISDYQIHNNKQKLIKQFNDSNFMFDHQSLSVLRSKQKPDVVIALKKLIKTKYIGYDKLNNSIDISNYIIDGELNISDKQLDDIIDVIADEILNPLFDTILFSRLFINVKIDKYRFMKHPNETLSITFI